MDHDDYIETRTTYPKAVLTALKAAGITAEVIGTGGNCSAIQVSLGEEREILVTDSDADLPNSYGLCAYFYDYDTEDNEAELFQVNPLHPDFLEFTVNLLVETIKIKIAQMSV